MEGLYAVTADMKEKSFSVSGSEEFVNKYVEYFTELFSDTDTKDEGFYEKAEDNTLNSGNKFIQAGIYSIDEEGVVNIHTKIPGKDKSEKTRNVALIVLFAKNDKILGSELRSLCEKQACFDNSNFAKTFERDISNFIKKKVSARQWTIELTINGRNAAEKLLNDMLDAKQSKE